MKLQGRQEKVFLWELEVGSGGDRYGQDTLYICINFSMSKQK